MSKLATAYTGHQASEYDTVRNNSPRWMAEQSSMKTYISTLMPKIVLDCPYGTGRWNEYLDEIEAQVMAVDISSDMLSVAKSKVHPSRAKSYRFINKSIYDLETDDFKSQADLICCIRFLNWLNWSQVSEAVEALSTLEAKDILIGCSVEYENQGYFSKFKRRIALNLKNLRKFRYPNEYVHRQDNLIHKLSQMGYVYVGKKSIFENYTRQNSIYHFSKKLDQSI